MDDDFFIVPHRSNPDWFVDRRFYDWLIHNKSFKKLKQFRQLKDAPILPRKKIGAHWEEWLDNHLEDDDWEWFDTLVEDDNDKEYEHWKIPKKTEHTQENRRRLMTKYVGLPADVWWLIWQFETFTYYGTFPTLPPSNAQEDCRAYICASPEHLYMSVGSSLYKGWFDLERLCFRMKQVWKGETWIKHLMYDASRDEVMLDCNELFVCSNRSYGVPFVHDAYKWSFDFQFVGRTRSFLIRRSRCRSY
jgi:hypothetical protein